MKTHIATVVETIIVIVVETIIIILLLNKFNTLNNQLKEAQTEVKSLEEKYEGCVEKSEVFQELYYIKINEISDLQEKIREYEPDYGLVYF